LRPRRGGDRCGARGRVVIRITAAARSRILVVEKDPRTSHRMPSDRLSIRAQRFLAQDVSSVMQLELVLALHRDPAASWTPAALAGELRAPAAWIVEELTALLAVGVARSDDDGTTYRLERAGADSAGLDEIAAAFPRRRTSIINLIFAATPGSA
jgi:hypothetical protein